MTRKTELNEGYTDSERQNVHDGPADKPFLRRAAVSAIVGTVLIGTVQFFAPSFDYQIAFLICLVVGLISLGLTLFFLERAARAAGHAWVVPITALAVLLTLAGLVRVRTLSGDMIPQFEWRFTSHHVPELQTSVARPDGPPEAIGSRDTEVTGNFDAMADGTRHLPVDAPTWRWGQFLGEHRDGSVEEREFAIPKSGEDVKPLWNIGIGEGWSSFAVADQIAVTLEQRDQRECVTAYRMNDGELLWIVEHEAMHSHPLGGTGPRSTPTIANDRVYAQGATGMVWCLDLISGEVIWQVDLLDLAGWDQTASEAAITWGRSGSPLLVDDLCVVPLGGDGRAGARSLVAFDAANGEVRWKAGDDQISYASPQLLSLTGERQIVIVNENTITGHAIGSGAELWQTDWAGQSNGGANCSSVIPAGKNRFFIGKGYGVGSALIEVDTDDSGDGLVAEDVWRSNRIMKTKFNHAVIHSGAAYGLSNGALQAINLESGERLWEQSRGSRSGQGQVIRAGDTLIVQEEMGDILLVAADPHEYRELVRIQALDHKTWNVPSLIGNVLLVRNSVEAIALQLPALERPLP